MAGALNAFNTRLEEFEKLRSFSERAFRVRALSDRLVGKEYDGEKVYLDREVAGFFRESMSDTRWVRVSIFLLICFAWERFLQDLVDDAVSALLQTTTAKPLSAAERDHFALSTAQVIGARDHNDIAQTIPVAGMVESLAALYSIGKAVPIHRGALKFFVSSGNCKTIEKVFERLNLKVGTIWDRIGKAAEIKALGKFQAASDHKRGELVCVFIDDTVRDRNLIVHGVGLERDKSDSELSDTLRAFGVIAKIFEGCVLGDAAGRR